MERRAFTIGCTHVPNAWSIDRISLNLIALNIVGAINISSRSAFVVLSFHLFLLSFFTSYNWRWHFFFIKTNKSNLFESHHERVDDHDKKVRFFFDVRYLSTPLVQRKEDPLGMFAYDDSFNMVQFIRRFLLMLMFQLMEAPETSMTSSKPFIGTQIVLCERLNFRIWAILTYILAKRFNWISQTHKLNKAIIYRY